MTLSAKAAHRKDLNASAPRDVFQHRHYREIARIIRTVTVTHVRDAIAARFAAELATQNSNFDFSRFIRACEGE